ncbi:11961_t:CDS:2, partial [Cetraspora pellucida]
MNEDNESLSNDNNENNRNTSSYYAEDSEIFANEDNYENINGLNSMKILGILNKEIEVEPHVIDIINIFKEYKAKSNDKLSEANIINLSPDSEFVKQIPLEIYKEFIESSENYDKLIPNETRNFLMDFFSQDLAQQQWTESIDNLNVHDYSENITKIAINAFSLGHMNPLHNKETLEDSYLNDYIHPCLKSALWNCANVYYTSGEITSPNHVNRQKGDGVGFATNSTKYQVVYVEGTRPYKVDDKKVIENQNKLGKNLKNLYSEIIKERVTTRKRIMPDMEVFGVSSVRRNIHMYIFGFFGEYYLREVDNASVPRDYTEMEEFIYFYEVILKWA